MLEGCFISARASRAPSGTTLTPAAHTRHVWACMYPCVLGAGQAVQQCGGAHLTYERQSGTFRTVHRTFGPVARAIGGCIKPLVCWRGICLQPAEIIVFGGIELPARVLLKGRCHGADGLTGMLQLMSGKNTAMAVARWGAHAAGQGFWCYCSLLRAAASLTQHDYHTEHKLLQT